MDVEPKTTAVSHQMLRHLWLRAKPSHPTPQNTHSRLQKENSAVGQNTVKAAFPTPCWPFCVSCHRRGLWRVPVPRRLTQMIDLFSVPGTVLGSSISRFIFSSPQAQDLREESKALRDEWPKVQET